jgi:hypothetical protein
MLVAAPTKNIENNPMHSSRRPPRPTVRTENLTRRANQRHNFIIPKSSRAPFRWNRNGALVFCFDAFSSREPVPISLENALNDHGH